MNRPWSVSGGAIAPRAAGIPHAGKLDDIGSASPRGEGHVLPIRYSFACASRGRQPRFISLAVAGRLSTPPLGHRRADASLFDGVSCLPSAATTGFNRATLRRAFGLGVSYSFATRFEPGSQSRRERTQAHPRTFLLSGNRHGPSHAQEHARGSFHEVGQVIQGRGNVG